MESGKKRYYFKCPNCGSDADFREVDEQGSGLGLLLFLLGHWVLALLYADIGARNVRCGSCNYIFRRPGLPRTGASRLAWRIILTMLLCAVGVAVVFIYTDWLDRAAEVPVVAATEQFVRENAKAVAVWLIVTLVLILAVCVLTSWISNMKLRRKIRREYETMLGSPVQPREGGQQRD
jgi:hypothetical protein